MNKENVIIIAPENPGTETIEMPVLKVFDGDGFLTKIKTYEFTGNPKDQAELEVTIRFGFIDAPELGQPGGHEAKDFLTFLIGGRWVELVVLTKMDTGRSVDRHGRIVCVPYVTQDYSGGAFRTTTGGFHQTETFGKPLSVARNIELEMVLNGWAWVLERYGPDARYLDALADARRNKRGIWAWEENIEPWEFKRRKYREKQPVRTPELLVNDQCPMDACGGRLLRRNGKFGAFLGCSNFPNCKYSCSADT